MQMFMGKPLFQAIKEHLNNSEKWDVWYLYLLLIDVLLCCFHGLIFPNNQKKLKQEQKNLKIKIDFIFSFESSSTIDVFSGTKLWKTLSSER